MNEQELFSENQNILLNKLVTPLGVEISASFSGKASRQGNNICIQYIIKTTGKIKIFGLPAVTWENDLVDFGKYCWNPEETLCYSVERDQGFLELYRTGTKGKVCLENGSLCIQKGWEFYVKALGETARIGDLPKTCIPIPA